MWFKLFVILLCSYSFAESSFEVWKSRTGSEVTAKVVEVNLEFLLLEKENGKTLKIKMADFSSDEDERIQSLLSQHFGSKIEGIDAKPGEISERITVEHDSQWHYYVYLPESFHVGKKWPVWFITSAGGGANGKPLKRYIPGAEALDCILIISEESRNKFNESKSAALAMTKDVYNRFPVEEGFAFTSGMSGGGRMAFLTAEFFDEIAGVLACGAGDGIYLDNTTFRTANLRSSTYVYSLIGTNCFNRTGAYKGHTSFPDHYRLRFFKGRHIWADSKLIEEGMIRVVGEALIKKGDFSFYQKKYLEGLRAKVEELSKSEPWEAYTLADLGVRLTEETTEKSDFAQALNALSEMPEVIQALEAESKILKLCEEFYLKFSYGNGDRKPNQQRSDRAKEYARGFEDIPHGEILQLLGEKS